MRNEEGANEELLLGRYRVSIWDDENFLEMDGDNSFRTV